MTGPLLDIRNLRKAFGALHVTEQAAAGPRDGACAVPSIAATRGKSGAVGVGPSEEDLWAAAFRTGEGGSGPGASEQAVQVCPI